MKESNIYSSFRPLNIWKFIRKRKFGILYKKNEIKKNGERNIFYPILKGHEQVMVSTQIWPLCPQWVRVRTLYQGQPDVYVMILSPWITTTVMLTLPNNLQVTFSEKVKKTYFLKSLRKIWNPSFLRQYQQSRSNVESIPFSMPQ